MAFKPSRNLPDQLYQYLSEKIIHAEYQPGLRKYPHPFIPPARGGNWNLDIRPSCQGGTGTWTFVLPARGELELGHSSFLPGGNWSLDIHFSSQGREKRVPLP